LAILEHFGVTWEVLERAEAWRVRQLAQRIDDLNREAERQEAEARRNG
jgi:hypothetical protein